MKHHLDDEKHKNNTVKNRYRRLRVLVPIHDDQIRPKERPDGQAEVKTHEKRIIDDLPGKVAEPHNVVITQRPSFHVRSHPQRVELPNGAIANPQKLFCFLQILLKPEHVAKYYRQRLVFLFRGEGWLVEKVHQEVVKLLSQLVYPWLDVRDILRLPRRTPGKRREEPLVGNVLLEAFEHRIQLLRHRSLVARDRVSMSFVCERHRHRVVDQSVCTWTTIFMFGGCRVAVSDRSFSHSDSACRRDSHFRFRLIPLVETCAAFWLGTKIAACFLIVPNHSHSRRRWDALASILLVPHVPAQRRTLQLHAA
mmetsp:Transcript_15429/g.42202  ORF Transcript_15429/g.42202 Transcript_15429/m.42202 type:complete len:309 (+) Transcript_15429:2676-3602(+)